MIQYSLPKSLKVNGTDYPIRWDVEAALDAITALSDIDLSDREKVIVLFGIIYKDEIPRADQEEALKKAFWFLDGGDKAPQKKSPRVVDWEKDFPLICAPVNRVLGYDFRADPQSLHWWTFLAAYMEIGGDCLFAQVVNIRDKRARGKKLEKYEKEWASRNSGLINIESKYSKEDNNTLAALGIKRKGSESE
jgi:hypothetical protein